MKKFLSTFLFCSLALLLSALMVPSSVEGAIVNGGFEDNTNFSVSPREAPLTNWIKTQSVGTNEVIGIDSTTHYALAPHAGNISAAFFSDANAPDGTGASLTQTLTTNTALTYNMNLWLANPIADALNQFNRFSVSWDGALISLTGSGITETGVNTKTYIVTGNTNWFLIEAFNLPVTTTSTDLVIRGRNNNWATLVDDVLVEETPEPSTVVMLGVGAALMGLRRRRQSRL